MGQLMQGIGWIANYKLGARTTCSSTTHLEMSYNPFNNIHHVFLAPRKVAFSPIQGSPVLALEGSLALATETTTKRRRPLSPRQHRETNVNQVGTLLSPSSCPTPLPLSSAFEVSRGEI